MKVPPQAVHSTICACFYAQIAENLSLPALEAASQRLAWGKPPAAP